MLRIGLLLCLSIAAQEALAQPTGLLRPDDEVHAVLVRQQTLGRLPEAFLAARPLSAREATRYLDSLATDSTLRSRDRRQVDRLLGRTPYAGTSPLQRLFGRAAYADGRNLFAARDSAAGYALALNPIADVRVGVGRQTRVVGERNDGSVYFASRGIRTSGSLGRLFFESRVEEIQEQRLGRPDTLSRLPRERNVDVLNRRDSLGRVSYDYGRVAGVVGYGGRFVEARFGRDRVRLGPSDASLWLSNYAPVYDHLMLRTTVWRLQYTNVFAALESYPAPSPERVLERKYGAFHQLELALPARVRLYLFEAVTYLPDVESGRGGFDVSFLNPIILYRHVEDAYNRRGNKALGLGASWIPAPGVSVYGQALLTEFKASELFSDAGWWGNKWGAGAGLRLADPLGASGLDVTLEGAAVRPYTYSHHAEARYTHFRDPLGFPAGQNLYDVSLRTLYRPVPAAVVRLNGWWTQRGRDTGTTVFGGDPLRSYNDRSSDYGVAFLDGVRVDEGVLEGEVAYELLPGLFLGLAGRYTHERDEVAGLRRSAVVSASARWGLPFPSQRY